MMEKQLVMGVLLPHTRLYGGVKRFLELGNEFVKAGHRFIVYTEDGMAPDWFDFKGEMATFADINATSTDALFTTTVRFMPMILESKARHKIFYHVRKTEKIAAIASDSRSEIYACSGNVLAYDKQHYPRKHVVKAFGGVNTSQYTPVKGYMPQAGEPFIVMAYGRLAERVKGTKYVVKACERLYRKGYDIKLLLYDTPTGEKGRRLINEFDCKCPYEFVVGHPFARNSELFGRCNVFVSAENPKYSGWNNTVAEAMACALPVISTSAGTLDLLTDGVTGLLCKRNSRDIERHIEEIYHDVERRRSLGNAAREHIMDFDWSRLASYIINEVKK